MNATEAQAELLLGDRRPQGVERPKVRQQLSWDERWLNLASHVGQWSKDPNTKVGCVIVNRENLLLSIGYNGFPRRTADDERLCDKNTKNLLVVHAETNALCAAAHVGHSLMNAVAYVTRPPCTQCAGALIQAGITTVHHLFNESSFTTSTWAENHRLAIALLIEAEVIVSGWPERASC